MKGLFPVEEKEGQSIPALWRNRTYVVFWFGQAVSSIGGNISQIAFPWLVLSLTHSPAAAGIVGMMRTLPNLLYLIAGALVDRWNRKAVMIWCDLGRLLNLLMLLGMLFSGLISIWLLALSALLEGILLVFFSIAHVSSLPALVQKTQLGAAQAQEEVTESITGLVGPSLAGVLYAASHLLPFLFDAISYLVSLFTLFQVKLPARAPQKRQHLLLEIMEGMVWMWKEPVLRTMNLCSVLAALVLPGEVLILMVLAKSYHVPDVWVGLIFAADGLGAIAGALIAPFLRLPVGWSVILVRWCFVLFWPLSLLGGSGWTLGLVNGLIGLVDPLEDVPYFSYRMRVIPDELRGRVISACRIFTSLTNPLGQLLTGLLLERLGATSTVLLGWLILILVASLFTLSPHMRRARL